MIAIILTEEDWRNIILKCLSFCRCVRKFLPGFIQKYDFNARKIKE
jgi:hypothetical protein